MYGLSVTAPRTVSRLLGASAIESIILAASTTLPWYGLSQPTGLYLNPSFDPLSSVLSPIKPMGMSPGQQDWGLLILLTAVLVALLAMVGEIVTSRHPQEVATRRNLILTEAIAATAMLAMVGLEVIARPPFGDGPALSLDWGGVVGIAAATGVAVAAWCAWRVSRQAAVRPVPDVLPA